MPSGTTPCNSQNKSLMPSRWLNSLRDDLKIWRENWAKSQASLPNSENAKR